MGRPVGDYFLDVRLHLADGAGHFTPLECAQDFATLILNRVDPAQTPVITLTEARGQQPT